MGNDRQIDGTEKEPNKYCWKRERRAPFWIQVLVIIKLTNVH